MLSEIILLMLVCLEYFISNTMKYTNIYKAYSICSAVGCSRIFAVMQAWCRAGALGRAQGRGALAVPFKGEQSPALWPTGSWPPGRSGGSLPPYKMVQGGAAPQSKAPTSSST